MTKEILKEIRAHLYTNVPTSEEAGFLHFFKSYINYELFDDIGIRKEEKCERWLFFKKPILLTELFLLEQLTVILKLGTSIIVLFSLCYTLLVVIYKGKEFRN